MMQKNDSAEHSNYTTNPIRCASAWILGLFRKYADKPFLYLLEGQEFGKYEGIRQIGI